MRKSGFGISLAVIALAVVVFGYGCLMISYPGGRLGMTGPAMMRIYGPEYGLGVAGGGPGAFGRGWGAGETDLSLSVDEVRGHFERLVAWQGNTRLKVGDVKERNADAIGVDIVTGDNSLVERFVVNRHNGFFQPSED